MLLIFSAGCADCLGRTPYGSLIATITLCLGVGLFCGTGYRALDLTLNGIFVRLYGIYIPWQEGFFIIQLCKPCLLLCFIICYSYCIKLAIFVILFCYLLLLHVRHYNGQATFLVHCIRFYCFQPCWILHINNYCITLHLLLLCFTFHYKFVLLTLSRLLIVLPFVIFAL